MKLLNTYILEKLTITKNSIKAKHINDIYDLHKIILDRFSNIITTNSQIYVIERVAASYIVFDLDGLSIEQVKKLRDDTVELLDEYNIPKYFVTKPSRVGDKEWEFSINFYIKNGEVN